MSGQRMPGGASLDLGGNADIHLKMCKKVAQLTKVIYVLNTRLDENDSIVSQLKTDHEKELELVRTETADKLRIYRNVVDQLSAVERKNAELDECLQLQKRQEVEALTRFESFKRETAERERTLRDGYSTRILELGSEVLKIKHQLEEKISELNKLSSERSVDKDKLNNAEELERRYKDELTKLRDRNLQLQGNMDNLKNEYETMLSSTKAEFEVQEKSLKSEIAKLEQELTKSQASSANEIQSNVASLVEKHNKEVTAMQGELEKLRKSLSSQESQYQIRINDLVQRLATSDALIEELRAEIQRQNDVLNSRTSDSNQLSKQLMEASAKTNSLIEENHRLESEVDKLTKRCAEISRDVLQKSEELSVSESNRLHLESLSNDLRRELDSTKKVLAAAEANIKEFSMNSSELETRLKARLSDLETELGQIRRDNTRLVAEVANQRLLMTEEHTRKQNELISSHENQILVLTSRHEEELTRERLLSEEKLGKLSRELLGNADSIREQFEAEKTLLISKYEREVEDLRKDLAAREKSIGELQENCKNIGHELSNLKRQQEATSSEAKDAVWQLAEARRRVTMLEDNAKVLEAENADMKTRHPAELEKLATQNRLDLDAKVREVEASWAEKLRAELQTVRRTLLGESEQKYQNSIDELQKQKEAELQAVKEGWQKKTNDLLKELSEMRQKLSAAETRLSSETARLRSDYDAQLTRLRDEIQAQTERFNDQLKVVKRESDEESAWLLAEKEKAIREAESRFKAEQLEAMQAQAVAHRSVVESLNRQHEMEKTRSLEEAARQHSYELAEIRDALAKKHLAELEQASRFHDAQSAAVKQELEKVVELTRKQERDYEGRLEEMRRMMKQRDQRVSVLEEAVATWEQKGNALVAQLDAARHEATRTREQMLAEMRTREEEAVANIERELEQSRRDAKFQQQAMVEEFAKAQQLLKEKIGTLQQMLAEADERHRNRESREEDLSLIEELKERLRLKATELGQILNEKKSLEMELINRERNFNKIFSNSPQVGVIDPIGSMKSKRPSVDAGISMKNASRTHSGGSAGDVSSVNGSVAIRSTKGTTSLKVAPQQAWGASTQRLDPLPNSPIHDEPFNPLKPLPPAPKLATRIS